jgi:hypothetical protein
MRPRYGSIMRLFFRARVPHFRRILIVESGSRALLEKLIPSLLAQHPDLHIDLVTCYAGEPAGFRPTHGQVFRTTDYGGPDGRDKLLADLLVHRYEILGILCSNEPIMFKWKWWLAWKLPAKVLIINENADYFWFDYTNWKTIRHFVLFRAGLSGANAAATLGRLLLFPFTLLYLLLYAAVVHLRRKVPA